MIRTVKTLGAWERWRGLSDGERLDKERYEKGANF